MYIDNALNLAYSYAEKICNQAELDLVSDELIKIAGKTDEYTFRKDDMKYSCINHIVKLWIRSMDDA